MEFKNYSICDTIDIAKTNLLIIERNMVRDGVLKEGEYYSDPIPFVGKVDEGGYRELYITGKYFYKNPENEKYLFDTIEVEQSDINPNKSDIVYYRIYEYMNSDNRSKFLDWRVPPHNLDYKRGLTVKLVGDYKYDNKGNLSEVIYYKTANRVGLDVYSYEEPLIKYIGEYFYDSDGYTTHRIIKRYWMDSRGEWSGINETTPKLYDRHHSRLVGIRRRKNLINQLVIEVGGLILMTSSLSSVEEAESLAIPFFNSINSELTIYYEGGNKSINGDNFPLYETILNSDEVWLENIIPNTPLTIRHYILNKINV